MKKIEKKNKKKLNINVMPKMHKNIVDHFILRILYFRYSKISNFQAFICAYQNVAWFKVFVNNVLHVQKFDAKHHVNEESFDFLWKNGKKNSLNFMGFNKKSNRHLHFPREISSGHIYLQ